VKKGTHHRLYLLLRIGLLAWSLVPMPASAGDSYARQQEAMIREIRKDVERTVDYIGKDRLDPRVMEAMADVPRHRFVPERLRSIAYENRPLPIGHGQTISQPYIVALMTDLLHTKPGDVVLEVGTGSGYQAAVLSALVERVYTMEIIPPLAESAEKRLRGLGYNNVTALQGDGYYGLEAIAPFDAIVVTAAATHIPPPLIRQLKPGGVMIIPVGGPFMTQELIRLTKNEEGQTRSEHILPVVFVPLTGGH
jgi:protein-L-isoaspartate(D-aspartate) O-methyltransferase